MASGISSFFGASESAASYAHIASVSNFIAFLFFFVLPIGFQFLVVRDIAKRHGFENLNLLKLLGMICRHPALLKKFKPRSSDWLWIIGLYCCCCSPIGVGLFLTRPLAQICYQFRMNASQQEMEDALKQ